MRAAPNPMTSLYDNYGGSPTRVAPDGSGLYAGVPTDDPEEDLQEMEVAMEEIKLARAFTLDPVQLKTASTLDLHVRKEVSMGPSPGAFVISCFDRLGQMVEGTIFGEFHDQWRLGTYILSPEGPLRLWLDCWDIVVILALCATALVLPFEVAMIKHPEHGLYIFDNIINGVFGLDILLTFNVAYPANDSSARTVYQHDPVLIAANYMAVPLSKNFTAGWFWLDLITVIPWDILLAHFSAENLETVRLVRVLRMVRMLRLIRVMKLFKRWHTSFGFSFALVKITKTIVFTLLLVHWLACGWAHLGRHPEDYWKGMTIEDTWVSEIASAGELSDLSIFYIYMRSLYWCTTVLTAVGFGDIIPYSGPEHMMMIITIFITGLTWAWVVGNVVDVITNSDVYQSHFNQTMDDLNVLMRTRGVKKELTLRIRRHLYESEMVHRHRHQLQTVTWLSDSLQGEIAIESGVNEILKCVWYLRDLPTPVVVELAMHFKPDLFSPYEVIMDSFNLYVIRKGVCIRRGKFLLRGSCFGEDIILATDLLKDSVCPRTMTFVEVMSLGLQELHACCLRFPDFDIALRKAQIRLAVQRAFCFDAARARWIAERKQEKNRRSSTVKGSGETTSFFSCEKSMWDAKFFGKRWDNAMREKKTSISWAASMSKHFLISESENRALDELKQETASLRASLCQSEAIVAQTNDQLDDLERLFLQSQERSQKRLNSIDCKFDALEKVMTDLLRPLVPSA